MNETEYTCWIRPYVWTWSASCCPSPEGIGLPRPRSMFWTEKFENVTLAVRMSPVPPPPHPPESSSWSELFSASA